MHRGLCGKEYHRLLSNLTAGQNFTMFPADNLSIINPEIIEAMSQLLFLTTVDITTKDTVDLKAGATKLLFVPPDLK